jgi:anti-sigma regulatory factor (Ser/Thr protein kinase)
MQRKTIIDTPLSVAYGLGDLRRLRDELRLYLESRALPPEVTYDLLTCTQEACKNALRFAGTPRGVHASILILPHEVVVTVRDFGAGLTVLPVASLPSDLYGESGRGLFLMAALMDRVEFHVDDGTRVRLHKLLPLAGATALEPAA